MSIDIAREVTAALAEAESVRSEGWKWAKGVVLFPETRCPYCREVVRSKAIWVVRGNSLMGQVVPRAGRPLVLDPPEHPHATPSDICMGNAFDPLQALFTGLNPESVFVDMIEWLRGKYWKHSCDAMDVVSEPDEEEENTHEDDFFCEACEDYFSVDNEHEFDNRYYCQDCFNEHAFKCDGCRGVFSQDNRYSNANGSEDYCEDCYYDRYFLCDECDNECSTDELYADAVCNDCALPLECEECGEKYRSSTEGLYCVECILNLCPDCTDEHTHDEGVEPAVEPIPLSELESLGQERLPL